MRKQHLFIWILLAITSSCHFGEQKEAESPLEPHTMRHYEHGDYYIEYPTDWTLDHHDTSSTQFVLYAPDEDTILQVRHNINLVTQDLSKFPMNTREFLDFSVRQLKTLLKDSKVVTSEMIQVKNDSVGHIIHNASAEGIVLAFDQFFWVKDNKAYLLSLTSTEDWFKKNQSRGEEIMKSFRLK